MPVAGESILCIMYEAEKVLGKLKQTNFTLCMYVYTYISTGNDYAHYC